MLNLKLVSFFRILDLKIERYFPALKCATQKMEKFKADKSQSSCIVSAILVTQRTTQNKYKGLDGNLGSILVGKIYSGQSLWAKVASKTLRQRSNHA